MNNTKRFDRLRAFGATAFMAVALVFVLSGSAFAQPAATQPAAPIAHLPPKATLTLGKLQQKLDEPVPPATLHNVPLLEVLRGFEAGIEFIDIPGSTLSFLPYGEETRVSLRVPEGKKTSLQTVISALLEPLCLTYNKIEDAAGKGVMRIVPRPELHRVGRRATIDELDLLYQLRSLRIDSWKTSLLSQVQAAAGKPVSLEFDLTGLESAAAYKRFNDSVSKMAPGTVASLLDQFCKDGDWTWRVDGDSIRVVDKIKQVVHQLRRRVSIRWTDVPLEQALTQIARSAGVDMAQIQPGMFAGLDPASQRVTWASPDESILQVLEVLCGRTGISYEVHPDAIAFTGPRRNDPIVGQVTVGSRSGKFTYQLFIRRSMLAKEAQAVVDQQLKLAIDAMNQELTGTGSANPPIPKPAP